MDQNVQMLLAKLMEEKHTFNYKKLVVPMSMRSIYWKYFGFPATDEGEILTRVKIVCILCKTQIAYNRNTSNLRMHLQNKHAHELLELETANPPRRPRCSVDPKEKRAQKRVKTQSAPYIFTTVADGTVQIEGDVHFITDPNITLQSIDDEGSSSSNQNVRVVLKGSSPGIGNQNVAIILPEENTNSQMPTMVDGKTISDAITEFVILDLQLPDVVEGRGFQRLIATLRSPCEIPSKKKLEEELIPSIYDTFRESVQSLVSRHQDEMGLSVEEWNSANGETFITISVHFQQSFDPALETKVLGTLHCGSEMDTAQWANVFEIFFSEWDIKLENVTAVVTATTKQEILEALAEKGLTLVPCLVHSLQLCTNACFEQPEVVNILYKCRSIVALISHNSTLNATLRMQEQVMQLQLEENALKMDYPRVWTSTYVMLEQLLMRKNIIMSILNTADVIERDGFMLTEGEWKIMEDLVTVLEPFRVTIMTLSEEKTPLISLLKPLLCQLNNSHLKTKDSDSESARNFKISLSENLSIRYSDPTVNQLLQTATMLDPRFKLLPYANGDDKSIISGPIKEMLIKFVEEEQISNIGEEPVDKKSRPSGMEFLLGDLCSSKNGMPAEERADLELVQYQSESIAALDHCPLQWWAKASAKCPSLARLARKYNCVPASASPPHRIPMENQVLFDLRRASLGPDLVEKLIFLNGNHNV